MTDVRHEPLVAFIRESNRIEGIHRDPTEAEIEAHRALLRVTRLDLEAVEEFVRTVAGARLRAHHGMNVRVGSHVAPFGGPELVAATRALIDRVSDNDLSPWAAHVEYERLHPFMDGNGRSGRAIWAWQTLAWSVWPNSLAMGFLHPAYYAALSGAR